LIFNFKKSPGQHNGAAKLVQKTQNPLVLMVPLEEGWTY